MVNLYQILRQNRFVLLYFDVKIAQKRESTLQRNQLVYSNQIFFG